jgi:uncharacterized protein involved in type VI secretion and phage assembly
MAHIRGLVTGTVIDTNDPDGMGRVQVALPFLGGQNDSFWAPVAAFLAGGGRGAWFMPQTGDEVLVAFLQNDVAHPYVIGFLWNGQDKPPETDVNNRVLVTPGGHTLRFEDGDSKKVILKSSSGLSITLDDSDPSITLEGGGRILKMANGLVQIS